MMKIDVKCCWEYFKKICVKCFWANLRKRGRICEKQSWGFQVELCHKCCSFRFVCRIFSGFFPLRFFLFSLIFPLRFFSIFRIFGNWKFVKSNHATSRLNFVITAAASDLFVGFFSGFFRQDFFFSGFSPRIFFLLRIFGNWKFVKSNDFELCYNGCSFRFVLWIFSGFFRHDIFSLRIFPSDFVFS